MINKLKFGLIVLVALVAFGVGADANPQALSWTANQTVDLSDPDIDLTIVSGSAATSLVVGTGTIQVIIPNASVFTVTSASRSLVASGMTTSGVTDSCVAGTMTTIITGAAAGETITVTPGSSACGSGGTSGTGGGGSGSSSFLKKKATPATPADTTPPTDCLPGFIFSPSTGKNCNAATPATPALPPLTPGASLGNAYAFGQVTVKIGTKGEACMAWQSFLNAKANAGLVTDGWCGKLTIGAAKAWQASMGLVADGLLGPMSRAKAMMQ